MIKILKPGDIYHVAKCDKCGCKFAYDYNDIRFGPASYVRCPQCNGMCLHARSEEKKKKRKKKNKQK